MENLDDEKIQRMIEEQSELWKLRENEDAKLYSMLFAELSRTDIATENYNLADRIVAQIQKNQTQKEKVTYGIVIFLLVLFVSGLTYEAIRLMDDGQFRIISQLLMKHKDISLFILIAFCIVQVLDKYIVRNRRAYLNKHPLQKM